jgi:hypothetical protein
MTPSASDQFETMRLEMHQAMIEHDMLAQALRQQSLVSGGFILVLGLLVIWLARRNFQLSQGCLEQQRWHFEETIARERRHSSERIEVQKQHGLELDSTMKLWCREFAESIMPKRGG